MGELTFAKRLLKHLMRDKFGQGDAAFLHLNAPTTIRTPKTQSTLEIVWVLGLGRFRSQNKYPPNPNLSS